MTLSPLRYPGGKSRLVPHVLRWLAGQSRPAAFVEPFAGGASVGLAVAAARMADRVILVERDPDVAHLWRTLLSVQGPLVARRLESIGRCTSALLAVLEREPADDVERTLLLIVRNRVSRAGILAPGAGRMQRGEQDRGLASRWYPRTLARRVDAIATLRGRVICHEGDGLRCLERMRGQERVAFFIDAPYGAGARLYRYHDVPPQEVFSRVARLACPWLMTYEDSVAIRGLAQMWAMPRMRLLMVSAHHQHRGELLISGRPLRDASGAVPRQAPLFAGSAAMGPASGHATARGAAG